MPSSTRTLWRTRNFLIVSAFYATGCGSEDGGGAAIPASSAGANSTNAGSSGIAGSSSIAGSSPATGGAAMAGATSSGGGSAGLLAGGGAAGNTEAGSSSAGAGGGPMAMAQDLWIAPNGNDQDPGTEAKPLQNLPYAIARLKPGFTVWIKAGTYKYTTTIQLKKSGTASMPFTISAAPGARPLIDFQTPAGGRGIEIDADYWKLVGFEITHASDNCIAISGAHNTIDNLTIHGCGDTGLQITVGTSQVADNTRGANNLILNTDSYENFDAATGGENADGFAAKLRIGPGNVFRGCRAFNNADDGWDFFAADDVVEIDGCWAFSNGKGVNGNNPAGDGNGFKLGGKPTSVGEGGAVHLVKNSFAFENLTCGYTQNSNPDVPKLSACGAKDNKTDYCQTLSRSGDVSMTMTAAQAKAVKRNADGSLPPMK